VSGRPRKIKSVKAKRAAMDLVQERIGDGKSSDGSKHSGARPMMTLQEVADYLL
jgi:hypothetical protein